jgi:hypothetical protein
MRHLLLIAAFDLSVLAAASLIVAGAWKHLSHPLPPVVTLMTAAAACGALLASIL